MIPGLGDIFHQSIYSIILYGFVARGTQIPESDIDTAVIVKSHTEKMHDFNQFYIKI